MIECVPNFSEGRDASKVARIVDAVARTPGVTLLGWESDIDHNRSVVTLAGPADAVLQAAVDAAGVAAQVIDLRAHQGVHPRLGAADVLPFVPLEDATLADCAALARRAAGELWLRHGIPSYFYESASPGKLPLEKVRRQGFEQRLADPALPAPDTGGPALHPTAGATCIGARNLLVAYNIDLETSDVAVAREIARRVRASGGGFPFVKAIGLYLPSRGRAQVSMNLTRFAEIPVEQLYAAVAALAPVHSSELIGLVPRAAFDRAPEFYRRCANFSDARILEYAPGS